MLDNLDPNSGPALRGSCLSNCIGLFETYLLVKKILSGKPLGYSLSMVDELIMFIQNRVFFRADQVGGPVPEDLFPFPEISPGGQLARSHHAVSVHIDQTVSLG